MTMQRSTKEILVGALAMGGLVLLLASSYGKGQVKPVGGFVLNASFGRVDGLTVGNEVQVGGVKVGSVLDARLASEGYRAEVVMWFPSDPRLPTDTSAAIQTDGLFGSKFIVLEPGGGDGNLRSGDRIRYTQDSMVVEELLELIISQGKAKRAALKEKAAE